MLARILFLASLMVLGTGVGGANGDLRSRSVFVEGEDFQPVGQGWWAGQGWADDIYEATSGDAVLGNDGGGGEAKAEVVIPTSGRHNVWVRYLKIGKYGGSFGLRIEQKGVVVFDGHYRTHPEGDEWRPMWEKFEADLQAGPATLTLYIAVPGIRQRVDCVLITADLGYEPNYRDFAPQVFLRFRLLEPQQPTAVYLSTYLHRAPVYYFDPGLFTSAGLGTGGEPVQPGQWSPWADISRYMDSDRWITTVKMSFRSTEGKPLPRVRAEFQVSPVADEAEAKTFREDIDGEIVSLVLPGNVRKYPDMPALASELSARHLEMVKSHNLPPLPKAEGKIPLELHIAGFGSCYRSTRVLGYEMEAARILGANSFNDIYGLPWAVAKRLGVTRGFLTTAWMPWQAWSCPTSPDLPKMMDEHFSQAAAQIEKDDPGALKRFYRNKLWDEPGTTDLGHLKNCESCRAGFRKFLQEKGFRPEDFGKATWEEIVPITREEATDGPARRLHYWSIEYRDLTNALMVMEGRKAAEKHLGRHVLTNVNFTDAPLSGWGWGLIEGPDWFLYGRLGATSLLWSEDWACLGPEVSGYIADMLRAAARPKNLPTGEYIICNDNRTLEQRAFSALMHGVRILQFYCYGPYYAFADGMVSDNPETQKTLGMTLRRIASAGQFLCDAKTPQAEVAILYGKSHEIWQGDAAVGTERRTMYLAMQHAHVPVDMMSEQDIAEGMLRSYKVLYLAESNIRRDAARAIAEWVRAGGTLHMCAGAGLRDEYNEPLEDLARLAGVEVEDVQKPGGDYREHYGIPHQPLAGEVKLEATKWWSACTMPLLGYRETCRPQGAQVLATFADGKPAILRAAAGKGTVLRFAFMPGLAYVRSANPGPNRLTVEYKPEQLSVLTAALKMGHVVAPIEVSEPLVEAQMLSGPTADIIVLANWAGKSLPKVRVSIRNASRIPTAGSLTHGPLKARRAGGLLSFELPLDATDVIVLRRR